MPSKPFCRSASEGMQSVILPSWNSEFEQTKSTRKLTFLGAVSWWARVDYASRASKKAPQGLFSPPDCSATAPQLFESTLESETSVFYKTKSPAYFHTLSIFGGRGWIRTTEAEKQQIYSLSPLATREHAHILFVSVAGRLAYFIIGFWICQPLFFISFLFLSIQ